ncbi:MAG: DUF1858 domain-containing protein [Chloroflexi bacterium]|nr:DUF1858 domain-containing protein [Chloroflexota bacterium]
MEITGQTTVYELLKEYPQLEQVIIDVNPRFKQIRSPVVRRTVTRVTSLRQAAQVGGVPVSEFVNHLREAVGQPPDGAMDAAKEEPPEIAGWLDQSPSRIVDGKVWLDAGKNPLGEINKELKTMSGHDVLLFKTDFSPKPLIDTLREQGYEVASVPSDQVGWYNTFIRKNPVQ